MYEARFVMFRGVVVHLDLSEQSDFISSFLVYKRNLVSTFVAARLTCKILYSLVKVFRTRYTYSYMHIIALMANAKTVIG